VEFAKCSQMSMGVEKLHFRASAAIGSICVLLFTGEEGGIQKSRGALQHWHTLLPCDVQCRLVRGEG